MTAYYTIDGGDPAGSHGVATTGAAVELARTGVTWDTLAWAYWPEPENPTRWSKAMGGRRFRALLAELLGERAWVEVARSPRRHHRT